ncbi:MAG: peptidoglycan DD-metalloendopeptidase family protein [Candidatus Thiodiazotropha sp. (ex Dulcina madagascariensis)]|nr:peptidoglycan DD-metalloendopeptidase family protein [Candidatus Thiodiazotropha sp. (ex Dulcina madagascariensis)]MCU7926435.1 peptidoglycan DD-metalloendopeptidase family protein [Candidatus Thiodiazotropha sp. (ex Dulcina madagascariensis)]
MLGSVGLTLLLGLLINMTGCSSRGSAPVYTRNTTQSPSKGVEQSPVRRKSSLTYYLVQPGDTLYSIAWRHYLEYELLAAWNGIRGTDYQIFPGQRLRLKPPVTRQRKASAGQAVEGRLSTDGKQQTTLAKRSATPLRPAKANSRQQTAPARPTQERKSKKSIKLDWAWPTKGRVVRTFSASDQNRKGIWIGGHSGQAIAAAEAGKVVYAGGGLVGYGNLIIIKHDQQFLSAYGYNRKLLVKEGDKLAKGDIVAHMGTPNSGGQPVLHFEIRKQGKPVNPLPLLPRK